MFYWLAVIFTFAMGTALGDLFATTFHLGYLASAFVFTALICVPLIAWRLGVNPVLTFWVAYILTRPIGASFADYFGMPKDISGMGLGHGAVSVVTLILVLASFIYLSRSGIDQPEAGSPAVPPHAQPQYGQPQYAQPQYGQPQYGSPVAPQYGDPRYGQPSTRPAGPAAVRPAPVRPACSDHRQGQQPQYGDPRQGDPRYATDPRRGNQQ